MDGSADGSAPASGSAAGVGLAAALGPPEPSGPRPAAVGEGVAPPPPPEGCVAGEDQRKQHDHHSGQQQDHADQPRHRLLGGRRVLGQLVVELRLGSAEGRPDLAAARLTALALAWWGRRRGFPCRRQHLGRIDALRPRRLRRRFEADACGEGGRGDGFWRDRGVGVCGGNGLLVG